jgi:glucokinase
MSHALAVDLGGTKTAMGLVDASGVVAARREMPSAHTLGETVAQLEAGLAGFGAPEIAGVGVIVPGIYNPADGTAWAPNLWGEDFRPLREVLDERFSVPVAIGNDRTASVLAEEWVGLAQGMRDVVFVAVGTGIGVGILAGGRVLEGAHGIGGAAGWMVVGGRWRPEYAARGGWETEAAGPALARRAGRKTAEEVVAAAREGDPVALDAIGETADLLALGIAGLIAVLDPEMVVLGGGLMQAGDLMIERIRRNALDWTQPVAARRVRIERTALGAEAGLLGAARLAWRSLES